MEHLPEEKVTDRGNHGKGCRGNRPAAGGAAARMGRVLDFPPRFGFPGRTGGLFAEWLYADEPRVVNDLRVPHGDPAGEFLAGQRSALLIPIYESGVATNAVVLTREEPNAFPPEQVPELVWMSNL